MKTGFLYALIVVSLFACAKPKDLEYVDFKNLKVLKWGFKESTVGMDIDFYNPVSPGNHTSVPKTHFSVSVILLKNSILAVN